MRVFECVSAYLHIIFVILCTSRLFNHALELARLSLGPVAFTNFRLGAPAEKTESGFPKPPLLLPPSKAAEPLLLAPKSLLPPPKGLEAPLKPAEPELKEEGAPKGDAEPVPNEPEGVEDAPKGVEDELELKGAEDELEPKGAEDELEPKGAEDELEPKGPAEPKGEAEEPLEAPKGVEEGPLEAPKGEEEGPLEAPKGVEEGPLEAPKGVEEGPLEAPKGVGAGPLAAPKGVLAVEPKGFVDELLLPKELLPEALKELAAAGAAAEAGAAAPKDPNGAVEGVVVAAAPKGVIEGELEGAPKELAVLAKGFEDVEVAPKALVAVEVMEDPKGLVEAGAVAGAEVPVLLLPKGFTGPAAGAGAGAGAGPALTPKGFEVLSPELFSPEPNGFEDVAVPEKEVVAAAAVSASEVPLDGANGLDGALAALPPKAN
jgi:hypothetical protein